MINKIKVDTDKVIDTMLHVIAVMIFFLPRLAWRTLKPILRVIGELLKGIGHILAEILGGW